MNEINCIVASGPVIIEDGKVLLNRHGQNEEDRKIWKFVGGRVEANELNLSENILENACKREVFEEMVIEVEIILPLKPMLIKHPSKPGLFVLLLHYLSKRVGEITPGDDIDDWGWFSIDELPENCAPNIAPVIESYKSIKRNLKSLT